MTLNNCLVLNINSKNLHLFGLTPANPFKTTLQEKKFFALLRILKDVPKDQEKFKWVQIKNPFGYASHIGFKIDKIGNCYKMHTKFAMELKAP